MIASAITTMTSLPSRKNASQRRSWVWKVNVLANRVMYHFVAYDVDDIMCFFYDGIDKLGRSKSGLVVTYERSVDVGEELFGQPLLNVDALEQTGETG